MLIFTKPLRGLFFLAALRHKNEMKKRLLNLTEIFSLLIIYAYGMSLLADYGWFYDVHSHFAIQYAIGGFGCSLLFLLFRKWYFALTLFLIALLNVYEVRTSYSEPWQIKPPHSEQPNLVIAQYNKLFINQEWDRIGEWMEQNAKDIDILFVQESGVHSLYLLQKYKKYFPYQFPERPEEFFNDISILSRYPFKAEEVPSLNIDGEMSGVKVVLQTPTMPRPLHLYSIHTQVAFGDKNYKERAEDLLIMENAIKNDPYPYKTFSGDLNLTPYSPVFKTLIRETGMKYNDYSWFPKTTWNDIFHFSFLKIPIDHVLYTPALKLISKEVGPSLGSDHNMVIARFHVPES
jgi:endonuclease/exonuclease/phosphatase (EEP) superfamily protein YafD